MSGNRYTANSWNQPISMFVPRPFDELYQVGQNMAKKHAESDAKMGSLSKAFEDIGPLATHVISEGSSTDPGIKYRATGYEDHKNKIINDISQEHDKLAADYSTGNLTQKDFDKRAREITQKYSGEYNKLKMASSNTKAIEKMQEEISKNPDHVKRTHLLNEVARSGSDLLQNPYGYNYHPGAIGKAADKDVLSTASAKGFEESMLKEGYGDRNDKTGMIEYKSSQGTTIGRVGDYIDQTFDAGEYGVDAQQQAIRKLNDKGVDWNTKLEKPIAFKDHNGKDHSIETYGDLYYTQEKESYKQAVIDKAVHQTSDLKVNQDWMAKMGAEDEQQYGLHFGTAEKPIQPGSSSATNLTNTVKSIGILGFEFNDNGHFINTSFSKIKPVNSEDIKYNIDGKEYTKDTLPAGYQMAPTLFGNDNLVLGPKGAADIVTPTYMGNTAKAQVKSLMDVATRLGIDTKGKDWYTKTETAIKNLSASTANYTVFDAGTIRALGEAYNVELDKDGNITNPGRLQTVTIKDANGALTKGDTKEDIASKNKDILKGARILGADKSIDGKTNPGDILIQSADGQTYTMNTGIQEFKEGMTKSHNMYSSVGTYIKSGKETTKLTLEEKQTIKNTISGNLASTMAQAYPGEKFSVTSNQIKILDYTTSKFGDKQYITALVPDMDGNPTIKNLVIDSKNQSTQLQDLGESARDLDQEHLKDPMKIFNKWNFKKATE